MKPLVKQSQAIMEELAVEGDVNIYAMILQNICCTVIAENMSLNQYWEQILDQICASPVRLALKDHSYKTDVHLVCIHPVSTEKIMQSL